MKPYLTDAAIKLCAANFLKFFLGSVCSDETCTSNEISFGNITCKILDFKIVNYGMEYEVEIIKGKNRGNATEGIRRIDAPRNFVSRDTVALHNLLCPKLSDCEMLDGSSSFPLNYSKAC